MITNRQTTDSLPSDSSWERFNSSLLVEVSRGDSTFTSSGVAIFKNIFLTAAHSVDCMDGGSILFENKKIAIKRVIIHPGYNPSKSFYENDIAIVILEESLPVGIRTESLSSDLFLSPGEVLERIGFGGRENGAAMTWTCPTFQTKTFNSKNFILEDNKSVVGDSGGPIYKNDRGELKLVGIHSTLEGADKTYVVNLDSYIPWIRNNIPLRILN